MHYYGDFENADDVYSSFCVSDADREGVKILFASYENEGYDGYAQVIFYKDEALYEVTGSHCSCYGLEAQWDPQLIDLDEIRGLARRSVRAYGADYSGFLNSIAAALECSVEKLTVKQIAMLAVLIG